MSRVGKKLLEIPSGVTVTLNDNTVTVKGPKGELTRTFHPDMKIKIEDNVLTVERPSDNKEHRALHGTTRSIIGNMVEGVSKGFERGLELVGVGYRASKSGNKLVLNVGYSHPVEIVPENGIEIEVPSQTKVVVKVQIKNVLELLLQTFALYVLQSLTKAKGSAMKEKWFVVKKVNLLSKTA